tara:strand:- start:1091 stop:1210 length:120 start_codon:yes stop_codon:yes gene_type:complete
MKSFKNKRWCRFMGFVKWYQKQGGNPLTPEQIERTFLKF